MKNDLNESKRTVSIRVSPEAERLVKLHAKTHGMTLSAVYETAVKAYLEARK